MLKSQHHILILTKSSDVEDDFDLISQYKNVEVGFTITSLDDITYEKYEPNSSLPSEKIRVLKKAKEMGIKTVVSIEPWIIGHTDPLEIVKQLHPFVDRWIVGVANYMGFELESYRKYVPALITYLIENNINYRFKAELDRVVKSYPILSRESYEKSLSQQVGDQ
jgi:DNA repair photolyase